MRRASRTDANQAEIVRVLRDFGVSVISLAAVGEGCPDLLCGFRGKTYLLEVKRDDVAPSASRLNAVQRRWHTAWQGQVAVVRCVGAALDALGIKECKGP